MEDMKRATSKIDTCPCGDGHYKSCCQPYHDGREFAETAEKLMRSRYSAYALKKVAYLFETTHPSSRHDGLKEAISTWANSATFLRLTVKKSQAGQKKDKKGTVEFVATYSENGQMLQRHENSFFEKVKKRWYYVGAADE